MNEIAQVANPLGGEIAAQPTRQIGAMANTDQQRAIAEVQAAMIIARSNPRDEKRAVDRILIACQRKGLAEQALYEYSRGGTAISGPSIRLAEAIAQCWGNISFGFREIEQLAGMSVVQAFAWDLETNFRAERDFHVPHIRWANGKANKLVDPRDIYEMVANQAQRRVRACILAAIPGDIIDAAVEQAEHTLKLTADTTPQGIQKLVKVFSKYGVSQDQLEARIQRRIDSITPAQYVGLTKICHSLRDDMSKPDDWFKPVEGEEQADEPKKGNEAAKDALKKKTQPKEAKPAPEPEPETEQAGEGQAEAEPDRDGLADIAEEVAEKVVDAIQDAIENGELKDAPPQADHIGPNMPGNAKHGDSWFNPDDGPEGRVKYAHDKGTHGIKWYLEPPKDPEPEQQEPGPAEDHYPRIKRLIEAVGGKADLEKADKEFTRFAASMNEDQVADLDAMLSDKRREVFGGGKR